MEKDTECSLLLNDIMKELTVAKDQSIEIANKLYTQTEKLENTSDHLDNINHEADISKWHINHIRATFGKVYKRLNNYPVRQKAKIVLNELKLKSKINQYSINKLAISESTDVKDTVSTKIHQSSKDGMLDKISSVITDIHYINKLNQEEIDKHNQLLNSNIEKVDTGEYKIHSNILQVKKILNK
tara:strand:+ start:7874 stop:8428 length:555 start_codon:yes stop_codon:yes gene_type:complete